MKKFIQFTVISLAVAGITYEVLFSKKIEVKLYPSGNTESKMAKVGLVQEGVTTIFYDTNGNNKKSQTIFKSNVEHGTKKIWNTRGNKIKEIEFVNGVAEKERIWLYNTSGNKIESYGVINDKKEGISNKWHDTGVRKAILSFKNDQLNGDISRYNIAGTIIEKSVYDNGTRIKSTYWTFDDKGLKQSSTNTINEVKHGEATTWHPNGQKASVGNFHQRQKDGLHTSWFSNGKLKSELNYSKGQLQGTTVRYNKSGKITEKSTYSNDIRTKATEWLFDEQGNRLGQTTTVANKIHGLSKTWFSNGDKKSESNYLDGSLDGETGTWYPNKIKSTTGRYIQGKKDGLHVSWYKSGQKSTELNYKSDKLDGSITRYNPAGLVIEQSTYSAGLRLKAVVRTYSIISSVKLSETPIVNDKIHGVVDTWYPNKIKSTTGRYIQGKKDGLHVSWHANGTKASEGNYIAGDASGLHVSWHKSGQKSTELNYKSGKLDGSITRYNPAGLVIEQSDYSAGLRGIATEWTFDGQGNKSTQILFLGSNKQGLSTSWHANGEKSTEGIFENNIATGLFTYWDDKASKYKELVKKGSVDVRETYFKAGQKHGEQFTRYPSSAIKSIIEFRRGNEINRSVWFHEDGTYSRIKNFSKNLLVSDRYFDEGKPHGKTKFYYDNGKLDTEIDYTGGIKNGLSIAYSKSGKVIEKINFKDDSFHGTLTEFWPNGKKLHQTNFDMNTKHGKHESWYESGIKQSEMTYVDGIIDGKVKWYYRDGSLSQIGTFQDGGLLDNPIIYITNGDGTSSQLQSYLTLSASKQYSAYVKGMTGILVTKADGFIKEVSHYVEGKKHGQFIDFHSNGAKKLEFTFKSPGTHYYHANGVIDLWHVNGLKRRTFAVVPDTGTSGGLTSKKFNHRLNDNIPKTFGHIKDTLQKWNDDGELISIEWLSAGKILKEFSYYPIGNKSKEMIGTSTGTYELRGIKGQYQSWYPNGTKERTLFVSKPCTNNCKSVSFDSINGDGGHIARNGLTIFWDDAGFLDTVVNLKNNSNPTYTEYWMDGNKRIEASNKEYVRRDYSPIMYHQRLKGKFTLWHKSGHKQYSATYKHHPSGHPSENNWRTKYDIPTKKISYLHGVAQWWDEAGNLVKEENWKNNKLIK